MPGIAERTVEGTLPKTWEAELDEAAVSIAWAASGGWLAAASASGAIYLFESLTGAEAKKWTGHRNGAIVVAWSPKEEVLASGGQDGKVNLFTPEGDAPFASLDCGTAWVEHLAWSPSGRYLATACGRTLRLWSNKGELLQSFEEQPNTIAGIDWRYDSEELVSACYGQVVFWKPSSSSPTRTFEWKGSMLSIAWSPDAKYLCHGNQDSTVHFWIVATGKELQMSGYPLKVAQICWERRSKYLATAGSPQITVWDCSGKGPAGRRPETLKHHRLPIRAMRYQTDGPLLASGCAEGRVAVWRPSKRDKPDLTAHLQSPITDVAWSPGTARLAVAAEDGRAIAFDVVANSK
ncbi:WD40 repeat domain-containing protein [Granulicella sp. WH15]|uniref:WD40 repeat domain-containing protein n=1 Tax=Granulicella sp. WH15 TaxID=2602070 RepID=UPI00136694D8|nr:WD40 repeat domain-containing protein [Granulicella sp. WH15]QHN02665.1 WD40 repeat domain-containing protein [Granulicella sp. WH15]